VAVSLRGSAALTLAVIAGCLALSGPAAAQQQPPNVVVIVTDDQRWDTTWAMPTVSQELIAKGVTFENAYVVNPLCCPSRASILTGTYSHTNGVWSNGGFKSFDDRSTVATWLDDAGYETALVGKYLNGYGPRQSELTYVPPGWDRWLAFFGRPWYFDYALTDGSQLLNFGPGPVEDEYSTDVLGSAAVEFVQSATPPFFLYFAPYAPHSRGFLAQPAPRHVGAFSGSPYTRGASVNEADVSDKPGFIRRRSKYQIEDLTELRETQLESLLAVDDAVDALLQQLRSRGQLGNTLILFLSDNGHMWGEHRLVGKRAPYEESIRIPLVARWDALGEQARSERRMALNIDIASTIARAARVSAPGHEGRNLLPLLRGTDRRWRGRFTIEYFDRPIFRTYCGTRSEQWKYVQYDTGSEELYRLSVDPAELSNLAKEPQRRARVMQSRARILESECRPPGHYRPLPLCSRKGTDRRDTMVGTRWRDWICAGGGRDTIRVAGGNRDIVRCGADRDVAHVGPEDETRGCERVVVQR
jgi:N-acetylglucosamine-6-sulfatase